MTDNRVNAPTRNTCQAEQGDACCTPSAANLARRDWMTHANAVPVAQATVQDELRARLIEIPGGFFEMGARKSTYPADLDAPRRKIRVSPFLISATTVTNADYARFVEATGYRTVAEVWGWSFVFHLLLDDPARWPNTPPGLPWWRQVEGASWAAPTGPGSSWQDQPNHPAIHIAWYDAAAYCKWAGLRLPQEAEWERAARGGLERMKFPWGNAMMPKGQHAMNIWQGAFPHINTAEDGYLGTAPADAFTPNGYGLYNCSGNVWEWVQDWFGNTRPAGPARDPLGPETGTGRVQRGGSYLCHDSYCDRYHVHSRTRNDPDSSTGNCGFRVAASHR
ncbi:formylglycine-generating enzyme family protein [Primorskyibacter marinus]|uniref:formylglycine-generating enzyme family protein n=1 Tax=Primorskyibacter marinus TaxID=1977320 RepID=UPI001E48E6B1|nr:formylglycine-generating enzyme family protein [Primorskyibacter marinus]